MPPYKTIKTYKRNPKTTLNLSISSITISKKRRNRIKIDKLPTQTSRYLCYDDSLKIETENTFDKLVKGGMLNKISFKNDFKKNITTSDSDLSSKTKTKSKSTISFQIHSPIMTGNRSKLQLIEITDDENSKDNHQSMNCNKILKSSDKSVDMSSLTVEKDTKKNVTFSSLSYIKIPAIMKVKQRIISSTPYYNIENTQLLPSTVSPIIPRTHKSEINSSNLTPKLSRNRGRRIDTKLSCPPRVLLEDVLKNHNYNSSTPQRPQLDSPKTLFKGFNDEESQKSVDESHHFDEFVVNVENQQISNKHNNNSTSLKQVISPKIILDDCFKGFNDEETQKSMNEWQQFNDFVVNLENQQIIKANRRTTILIDSNKKKQSVLSQIVLDDSLKGFNDKETQKSMNESQQFTDFVDLENESAIISSLYLTGSNLIVNVDNQVNDDRLVKDNVKDCPPPKLSVLPTENCSFNLEISHDSSDIIESSIIDDTDDDNINQANLIKTRKKHNIKPGKLYRRSIVLLKQSFIENSAGNLDSSCRQSIKRKTTLRNSQIIPLKTNYRRPTRNCANLSYVQEQEEKSNVSIDTLETSFKTFALRTEPELVLKQQQDDEQQQIDHCITAREIVLRKCQQTEPNTFEKCYPDSILNNCHKIGEGVYGEVFLYKKPDGISSVIKIIPIEGDLIVNGERQKTFEEVLSEIIISLGLSNLRKNGDNQTTAFVEVQKVNCVIGRYPDKLIDLWLLYNETKGSENDSPEIFPNHQMYIVLELTNGGQDAESFVFNNALQTLSMFKQVACALAVAETELKFEHRDLHWGNVLIKKVDSRKKINFLLNGHNIEVSSHGVEVTIIDYTLSRAQLDGVVVFNDLSHDDDLFKGTGDYQFEIYQLMQQANRNNWQDFQPQSNILWLHYLLKKMLDGLRYLNIKTKIHRENMKKINELEGEIIDFDNAVDFVKHKFIKKSKICKIKNI